MKKPYGMLRIARWVFLVLAYVNLAFALYGSLTLLIVGGEPLPVAEGFTIPVRVLGLFGVLISTPLAFLLFYVPSGMIRLGLDLMERLPASSAASGPASSS